MATNETDLKCSPVISCFELVQQNFIENKDERLNNFFEQTEIRMLLLPLTSSSAIIGITEMSRVPFQKSDQTGREKFGQESKTTSRFGSGRWLLLLLPPMPLWRLDFESDDANYPSSVAELAA